MCFTGYHLQNIEQILWLSRKNVFVTNPYFFHSGTIQKWCHQKTAIFEPPSPFSLFVTNISNPFPPGHQPKSEKYFQINHLWKCILGSISCMFITQYPIPDLHFQTVKWENIFDLYSICISSANIHIFMFFSIAEGSS